MEITEINMISNFEAGMNCLQNPSLISRFFAFPGQQVFIFWKWGALILAIFATFGSLIRRIKLLFIHFRILKSSSHHKEEIFDFSEEDDQISLASSSSDDEDGNGDGDDDDEEEDLRQTTSRKGVVEDFRVKNSSFRYKAPWQSGQLRQRRRRSSNCSSAWSEFTAGKNVVKLWDSLGFNLDFDEDLINYDPQIVVSTWEFNQSREETELSGGVWNIPASSPTVLLTAKDNGKGDGVVFSGYDSRMRRRVPALYAEWKSPAEKLGVVSTGGVGKVYVRDDVSGAVTVGDVRNVGKALENVKEYESDTWWDADAVMVDEKFQESH